MCRIQLENNEEQSIVVSLQQWETKCNNVNELATMKSLAHRYKAMNGYRSQAAISYSNLKTLSVSSKEDLSWQETQTSPPSVWQRASLWWIRLIQSDSYRMQKTASLDLKQLEQSSACPTKRDHFIAENLSPSIPDKDILQGCFFFLLSRFSVPGRAPPDITQRERLVFSQLSPQAVHHLVGKWQPHSSSVPSKPWQGAGSLILTEPIAELAPRLWPGPWRRGPPLLSSGKGMSLTYLIRSYELQTIKFSFRVLKRQ